MTRYLICGGRDFADMDLTDKALSALILHPAAAVVIHGGAQGADTLAGLWADMKGIPVERYLAKWESQGNSAGVIRNKRMLTEGKPDVVIAFPGGRGTRHMVKIARAAGVVTILVTGAAGDWYEEPGK